MTTEQAINILDSATAILQVSRQDHVNIVKALEVLRKFVAEKKDEKAPTA